MSVKESASALTSETTVSYYLMRGAFALFLQCSWGGAYMDADAASRHMLVRFREAEHLPAADTARRDGRLPNPRRLVVAAGDFYGSCWAILTPAPEGEAQAARQDDEQAIEHASDALDTGASA
jgi:hypothetical protein